MLTKLWRWQWTYPCCTSPYLTTLCLLWNLSSVWDPQSLRNWSGRPTSTPSCKGLSRECTSCANSGASTCLRSCSYNILCNHSVCSLCLHLCLVWISQTGQEQTATDSQDCRENQWCHPALHPGLIPLPKSGNGLKESLHPGHNLFQLLPSGRRYRTLFTKTTRHNNSFHPQAVTIMNTLHQSIVSGSLPVQ